MKIAVARPAAPAPTTAICALRDGRILGGEVQPRPSWVAGPHQPSSSNRLCSSTQRVCTSSDVCERLEPLRAARFGDDDLEARTLGRGAHFALHGLRAPLEEVEHRLIPDRDGRLAAVRESWWRARRR